MEFIDLYLGPAKEVVPPSRVFLYKGHEWVAEAKVDGCWAVLQTDKNGKVESFLSRKGVHFSQGVDFIGSDTGLPSSAIVGEYDTATQASKHRFEKYGLRRFWVFDVPLLMGQSTAEMELLRRRDLLIGCTKAIRSHSRKLAQRIQIVEQVDRDFEKFYKKMKAEEHDLILKKKTSLYIRTTSDGRTSAWHRSKDSAPVDLYVMGTGWTASRVKNLTLGALRHGKLVELQSLAVPAGKSADELVGKVIECEYDIQHDSGRFRHLRFSRERPDKSIEMIEELENG